MPDNLGNIIDRFRGLASGSGKTSLAAKIAGKSQPAAGLSESLRLGARTFSAALKNLNSVISVVNISQSTLEQLGEMTEKLVTLTQKATKSGIGQNGRSELNRRFKEIGKDFVKIIKKAEISDKNILTKDGLIEIFTNMGLDPEKSESVAAIFAKFVSPDKDDSSFLASEYAKGKRAPYIPPDAYGRGGASGQTSTQGSGRFEQAREIV